MFMARPLSLVLLVALGFAHAAAQETYTIKFKSNADEGKTYSYRTYNKESGGVKIFDADGKLVHEIAPKERDVTYTATVLEKGTEEGREKKFARVYGKAVETKDGKLQPLSYQGRTVVFERKEVSYMAGAVGKPPLDNDELKEVLEELNERGPRMSEVLTPTRPVAVGESWTINAKELARSVGIVMDEKASRSEAKLVKVYSKGKSRFGVIEVTYRVKFKELNGITLDPPGSIEMTQTIDTAIDGSDLFRTDSGRGTMKGKGVGGKGDKRTIEVDLQIAGGDEIFQPARRPSGTQGSGRRVRRHMDANRFQGRELLFQVPRQAQGGDH